MRGAVRLCVLVCRGIHAQLSNVDVRVHGSNTGKLVLHGFVHLEDTGLAVRGRHVA